MCMWRSRVYFDGDVNKSPGSMVEFVGGKNGKTQFGPDVGNILKNERRRGASSQTYQRNSAEGIPSNLSFTG